MKVLVWLTIAALLAWIAIGLWRSEKAMMKFFWPALIMRVIAGIALGLVYICYYDTGDTLFYFQDGKLLAGLAREDLAAYIRFLWSGEGTVQGFVFDMSEPRAVFLVKIVSVVNLISFDNYWISATLFSCCSFFGAWFFVLQVHRFIPSAFLPAAIAVLFFPSVVFWSSGLIKESIAMASSFGLAGMFLQIWFTQRLNIKQIAMAIVLAWLLWNIKYYFAAVFFPVVAASLLYRFIFSRVFRIERFSIEILVWTAVLVIPVSVVMFAHPNFHPSRLMQVIVENNRAFSALSSPGDLVHFYKLEQNGLSLLLNSPWALVSGLFRPFVWEADTIFQFVVGLENLLIAIVFLFSLGGVRALPASPHRLLVLSVILLTAALAIFITLSTPNFGTLSRYRLGYLPYFLTLMLCASRTRQFLGKIF